MKTSTVIFSIAFSTLILFNSLRVSCTYAYYEIDPVGFIEKLCENKDKPELQCNGKCHLKKVAESSTNTNNNEPVRLIDFREILLHSQEIVTYQFYNTITEKNNLFEYKNLYNFTSLNTCFKPPRA